MESLFWIVAESLRRIGKLTGFTYNEVNIIVYYILIPLSWAVLIDIIFKRPYVTILFVSVCGISLYFIKDFRLFSDWAFDKSVQFLKLFNKTGMNYIVASVVICVIVPALIYAVLIKFAFFRR